MNTTEKTEHVLLIEKLVDRQFCAHSVVQVVLPYDLRQKHQQRVVLENGLEAELNLPPGAALHDGDVLEAVNGLKIEVKAALEDLSAVIAAEQTLLLRACYHLGKRHIPAQIKENRISYRQDNMLDDMLQRLGLEVLHYSGTFEPEAWSYPNSNH